MQPLLHDQTALLRAPAQLWAAHDGGVGGSAVHGLWLGDTRILSRIDLAVGGDTGEHIATSLDGADAATVTTLLRHLDDDWADPRIRVVRERRVTSDGLHETIRLESTLATSVDTVLELRLATDLAPMDAVKSGRTGAPVPMRIDGTGASWGEGGIRAELDAPGAEVVADGTDTVVAWSVSVPARGRVQVGWSVAATDAEAVVAAPASPAPWSTPALAESRDDVRRWMSRALGDLDALRLETTALPGEQFLAAGAPWFFTLFGRDSIWAARLLLPLGADVAASTLRVLAGLQGTRRVVDTAEQPGKIMHELRRGELQIYAEGFSLPPLYYGTVDATPLWACLLHDAWRAGMPRTEVEALLPHLEAALAWMRDFGDSDGDGLLEYVDESGSGLSNQGWKDSGDSVQWRDGRLADGPIALCEVQAYAHEAAVHGAELLEEFGRDGSAWRAWAERLRTAFRERFWVSDERGAFPAIALDRDKHPVDSLTSNIGHLLGTGLLDSDEERLVAERLCSPELDSGFGVRTMSTLEAGYWPLSYHGGSVWAHDSAIAVRGLAVAGLTDVARALADDLVAAAAGFDYRMPELYSGDEAGDAGSTPVPYPAACRPQAWSAAAAVTAWDVLRPTA